MTVLKGTVLSYGHVTNRQTYDGHQLRLMFPTLAAGHNKMLNRHRHGIYSLLVRYISVSNAM